MKESNLEKYFYIYSYCFITSGDEQFSIYDSQKGKIHLFDNDLYEIASTLFRTLTIKQILSKYDKDDVKVIIDFLDYLESKSLGRYVSDISPFPTLETKWDAPYIIKRCIIDVRNDWHDFDSIFAQLSELLCPKIELRFFHDFGMEKLQEVITTFVKYDFGALFFLIPYNVNTCDHLSEFSKIIKSNFRINFNIYSIPENKLESLTNIVKKDLYLSNNARLSTKIINGRDNCGVIRPGKLHSFSIQDVMENKLYNGCLNRVIGIDENGFIRNCPSMPQNYGNINSVSLKDVISLDGFKRFWFITNSSIESCSTCEYRIVCLGCRAYVNDLNNIYSAPSKCLRLSYKKHEH